MRNMKKFLALVLAMMMVFSMAVITTSAADEADYTEAALQLNTLAVMQGDLEGNLMLDADVTRYQTALFFVRALTGKTGTDIWNAQKTSVNFADVTEYGTAIDYAYGVGVVKGRGNGSFGANDKILYKDMIVMAIRALGYETADMSYPYGHILAAKNLDLLKGIDTVDYEKALNRGETAQLIWNMLGTEVAAVDPLTDKVLYPGEYGLSGAINEELKAELLDRDTLLEKSGLAGSKFTTTIVEFVEGDEDEDTVDTVVLANGLELAAEVFGITVDTPAVTYAGLEVEVFVTVKEEDFTQEAYNDGDADVVLVKYPTYTVVESVGNTSIKYVIDTDNADKTYVSLDGTKFTNKNYEGELFLFVDGTWTRQPQEAWGVFATSFEYNTKDAAYVNEGNTYGKVAYRVIEKEDDKATVEVLWTPYTFGQYIERDLVSAATGKEAKFVILGTLTNSETTDIEGNKTYVTETLVDGNAVAKKVSKTKGEASLSVKVEGVEVKSGDFMFYNYNDVDNILTVAKNCGTLDTGRLTAYSSSKETVKVSGTNYKFGFADLYDAFTAFDADEAEDYVDALEAGKDNVQYLAVDGQIVWMQAYAGESDEDATYDFVLMTTDEDTMLDLLGLTSAKYNDKLVDGYYIEDGYVVVAALNLTTGKWELAKIAGVATDFDEEDEEFIDVVDVATLVKYAEIANLSSAKQAELDAAELVLATAPMFTVVEAKDGVYTIAEADGYITSVENADGLTFSANGKTNKITADEEVDAVRYTTNENTVIVVIGEDGSVSVRTGVQTSKKNVEGPVSFYVASANLIVMDGTVDADWGKGSAASADENYYVVMPGYGVEYETEAEEDYTLTIAGLFDLKTMKAADDVVITAEAMADLKAIVNDEDFVVGAVLFMDEEGNLAVSDKTAGEAVAELLGEDYITVDVTEWEDEESITVDEFELTVADAIAEINAKVLTINLFDNEDVDFEDLDLNSLYLPGAYDEDADYSALGDFVTITVDEVEYIAAELDLDDVVAEITEPTVGIFSNFEINAGSTLVAPVEDADAVELEVTYEFVGNYDEDTQVLNLVIVKIVK